MSLFTIPSTIFGYAKSAVKKLPGLIPGRSKKQDTISAKNTFKIPINNFTQTKIEDKEMTFDLAPKLRGLIEQIEIQNPNIVDGTKEFQEIISVNINPEKSAGVQNVNYNAVALETEFKDFIDQREQDYVRRMDEVLSQNKNESVKNFTRYDQIFDDFFTENLTLLHNLNNIVFHRVVSTDNFNASDLDLAKAFRHTQDLTKVLSEKILDDFQMLLVKLPVKEGAEEDTKAYAKKIKEYFNSKSKILLRGKHFGILDKDFVENYMSHYLTKVANGEELTNIDLKNLRQFQEGTHGCLLLKPTLEGDAISALDLRITKTIINDLNNKIINLSQIQANSGPEKRQELDFQIANIIKNLAEMAKTEKRVNESLELFSQDPTAIKLNIPREEVIEMRKNYEKITQIERFVGRTKDDLIEVRTKDGSLSSQKFSEEALVNSFTLRSGSELNKSKNYSNDFSQTFERLVLEASLLAGYHALAEHMDGMSDDKRKNYFKDNAEFANFDKEHVPWLRSFYKKELDKYRDVIKSDTSARKTADLAIQMCKLCQRLASKDIDIYQSNDFFRRYNLSAIAEKALKRVGGMTDINTMSLALKVYSEIFSNLEQDAKDAKLSKTETKWLSTHVEYLKELASIKDKSGNTLYALAEGNPYEQGKFKEIEAIFRDTELVSYNIDLVLKYFSNAIDQKKLTEKGSENYSDLESRNLLLSSALMYYYLKFMPETSKDSDSLRSREKVIQLLFDPKIKISKKLPKELGPKLLDHFFGTESNKKGVAVEEAKYKRQGFLRSYAQELENKLDTYVAGKEFKRVPLTDLLNFYYRLDKIKNLSQEREAKRNPAIVGKDLASVDDTLLGMWSRQEKAHIKFHGGTNTELLPPLKYKLKELLTYHSSDVMKFISTIPDPEIKQETSEFIAKELFKQSALTAKKILEYKDGDIVEVTDDDKELLDNITNTFGNLSRVANLTYKGNLNYFNLAENSVLGEDDRQEFIGNLTTIKELTQSKFLLVDVVNKTGEKVRKAKDIALNLLKAFNIRPQIGNHLQWQNEIQVQNYINELAQREKTNNTVDNSQKYDRVYTTAA